MKRLILLGLMTILILSACNLTAMPQPGNGADSALTSDGSLIVAWVDGGSLMVWRQGDETPRRVASSGVIRPYLAPDGQHIVFTRGPQGSAETLWVVDVEGTAEQELASGDEVRTGGDGQFMVGQVAWYDESILYFNTLQRYEQGVVANDDLYRANIRTREVALIRRPDAGGQFSISPDRQHIALVVPGTYDRQDAVIRVIDPLGQNDENLLFFKGVSTASEYNFYPQLFWRPDSSAILVAIPDSDLVYGDVNTPPADLWSLPVEIPGDRSMLGGAPASFFGLPRWSDSGNYMVYMKQVGDVTNNRFELVLANGSGGETTSYASGNAGTLEPAQWIPGADQFVFSQGESGVYWLGERDASPRRIPNESETMFSPVFVSDTLYVYATVVTQGEIELRYASLNRIGQPGTTIVSAGGSLPGFDAVIIR